ncbi:MAG: MerR family transcriptional regulator [Ardenticatenaceae bacterium]|nr:MerR family transcriptional regulator [Ardenticatenaceae bacterium]
MFRIGEFSKIAQVSGRLLRYYDQIDLLKPSYIDPWTSYRYYTADQLTRLNRILALKELGFSLDEIKPMVNQEITTGRIRDLYRQHKLKIEQTIAEEMARLQLLQVRLTQLERQDENWIPDVIIKQMPAQPVLTYRNSSLSETAFFDLFETISRQAPRIYLKRGQIGHIISVLHSELFIPEEPLDLEIGYMVDQPSIEPAAYDVMEDITLTVDKLPAVDQMATVVHHGMEDHPLTYNALGRWLAQNRYRIIGPGREILLENHYPQAPEKCIMEIQFPVARII